jgi:hypothetical protein
MIKMTPPDGCTSASIDGRWLEFDSDGTVDVETHHVPILESHGFSVPAASAENAGGSDPGQMNRTELFAFLKARGVSVAPPITNEELRVAARRACE